MTLTAMEMQGAGNSISANRTGRAGSQMESPVPVFWSLAMAPISPAMMRSISTCFLPRMEEMDPTFSVLSRLTFRKELPPLREPEYTRKMESFPTKGSATVLMTWAAKGADSSQERAISSPDFTSVTVTAGRSAGEGRNFTMASTRGAIRRLGAAAPPSMGATCP